MEEIKNAYHTQYVRENIMQVRLKLSKIHEPELCEWVEKQQNKNGAIKSLIARAIEEEKATP